MYKDETIDDTIVRIAKQEVGIALDSRSKKLVGQYVGKFKTENQRQDLSSGYYFKLPFSAEIILNSEHFSAFQLTYNVPANTGAMYRYYVNKVAECAF